MRKTCLDFLLWSFGLMLATALFCFFLAGCGVSAESNPPGHNPPSPLPSPKPESKIQKSLLLFSAPWCEPCHKIHMGLIPEAGKLERSEIVVYVETGAKQSERPTEESCRIYKEKLGAPYAFVPDPWKSTVYKSYFSGPTIIPAAVLLDSKTGAVLQKFSPGTFSAAELLSYLE